MVFAPESSVTVSESSLATAGLLTEANVGIKHHSSNVPVSPPALSLTLIVQSPENSAVLNADSASFGTTNP